MRGGPLRYKPLHSRRKVPGDDAQALDVYGSLYPAVAGMEMRSTAVVDLVVIHPDRDPVEAAYSRHPAILELPLLQNKAWKCRD